jgi:Protein of unknown function (DUF1116)
MMTSLNILSIKKKIASANEETVQKMMNSDPLLVDVDLARGCVPNLQAKMILHAGPPVQWERMCGALKGAIIGSILFEQWSDDVDEAEKLAKSGEIKFDSCHNHSAVGPMAGVISPNMPVFIIKNRSTNTAAYTNFNEGLGKVLRFGSYDKDVISRLIWMREELLENLNSVLRAMFVKKNDGLSLKSIISQALQMGDECHNRNQAGTSIFLRELTPFIMDCLDKTDAIQTYNFINSNNHFFLNLVLAAAKCMTDMAHNIEYSTIVTAIARNGTEIGIRVSGLGEEWFTHPAPIPDGLYFSGYSSNDANPDIGDSTITETVGLGGAAMAASPAIVQFVGGNIEDALEMTERFKQITVTKHKYFTIPYINFEGTPTGIDIRKVLRSGLTPRANTGIASKNPGVGQIGAGIVTLPIEPFKKSLYAYVRKYET